MITELPGRPGECNRVIIDEFDSLQIVDQETFERLTTPPGLKDRAARSDLQAHVNALRAAGYAAVPLETLRELIQAYDLVSTLKARLRARALSSP